MSAFDEPIPEPIGGFPVGQRVRIDRIFFGHSGRIVTNNHDGSYGIQIDGGPSRVGGIYQIDASRIVNTLRNTPRPIPVNAATRREVAR